MVNKSNEANMKNSRAGGFTYQDIRAASCQGLHSSLQAQHLSDIFNLQIVIVTTPINSDLHCGHLDLWHPLGLQCLLMFPCLNIHSMHLNRWQIVSMPSGQ